MNTKEFYELTKNDEFMNLFISAGTPQDVRDKLPVAYQEYFDNLGMDTLEHIKWFAHNKKH